MGAWGAEMGKIWGGGGGETAQERRGGWGAQKGPKSGVWPQRFEPETQWGGMERIWGGNGWDLGPSCQKCPKNGGITQRRGLLGGLQWGWRWIPPPLWGKDPKKILKTGLETQNGILGGSGWGWRVRNGGRGASWGAAMGGDWGGGAQKRPTDGGGGPQNGAGVLEPEMPPKWGLTPKFHPKRPQKWELGSRISAWRHRGGMEVRNGGGWGQKWGGFGGGGQK